MLGHQNFNTTLIYAEIQPKNCDTVNARLRLEIKLYLFLVQSSGAAYNDFNESYFTVGRNTELTNLNQNINRNINTLVIGSIGSGKSHYSKTLPRIKNLRLDDTDNIKKLSLNYCISPGFF
jgi:hypothetical protein